MVLHREVGADTDAFARGVAGAMRQDADVVLVGEMRDMETIALAVSAASMGMLVFGTLHTNSAAKTVDRIINSFPAEEQDQVRVLLASSLAGVVAQMLVPAQGRRTRGVHEILLGTRAPQRDPRRQDREHQLDHRSRPLRRACRRWTRV